MGREGLALAAAALLGVGLAGCGGSTNASDPSYAEAVEANLWLKQIRAEDPDTGALLARQCQEEVGFWLSSKGALEMTRCMRRKYDEGVRA